jgi:hypothetical protein
LTRMLLTRELIPLSRLRHGARVKGCFRASERGIG